MSVPKLQVGVNVRKAGEGSGTQRAKFPVLLIQLRGGSSCLECTRHGCALRCSTSSSADPAEGGVGRVIQISPDCRQVVSLLFFFSWKKVKFFSSSFFISF